MNKPKSYQLSSKLISLTLVLLCGGIALALTGVLYVDPFVSGRHIQQHHASLITQKQDVYLYSPDDYANPTMESVRPGSVRTEVPSGDEKPRKPKPDSEKMSSAVPESLVSSGNQGNKSDRNEAMYQLESKGKISRLISQRGSPADRIVSSGDQVHQSPRSGERDALAPPIDHRPAERGFTIGELMRWTGIFAVLIALAILLYIEFLFKERITQIAYRMMLLASLFILPVLVGLSATSTMLETTKAVHSCATCHVMDPFVNDLYDAESTTLAARHYKNKWIAQYQCYTCHTTYGAHGTFEGKRDGFRHWLLYVTRTWEDPIRYAGSYPNINCTDCHGGTPNYEAVLSHQALAAELATDRVSCTSCHGPAHPLPGERGEDVAYADLMHMIEIFTSAQLLHK